MLERTLLLALGLSLHCSPAPGDQHGLGCISHRPGSCSKLLILVAFPSLISHQALQTIPMLFLPPQSTMMKAAASGTTNVLQSIPFNERILFLYLRACTSVASQLVSV